MINRAASTYSNLTDSNLIGVKLTLNNNQILNGKSQFVISANGNGKRHHPVLQGDK
jgi:hypothetical protein